MVEGQKPGYVLEVCCSVYGGVHGGAVLITATGLDNRLDSIGGSQTFPIYVIELEEYGKCSVQKLQNEVYRLTNGCIYLNGVLQP